MNQSIREQFSLKKGIDDLRGETKGYHGEEKNQEFNKTQERREYPDCNTFNEHEPRGNYVVHHCKSPPLL